MAGGVWADESAWIDTDEGTLEIHLVEPDGLERHAPLDYVLLPEPPPQTPFLRGDCNDDGNIDAVVFSSLLQSSPATPAAVPAANAPLRYGPVFDRRRPAL